MNQISFLDNSSFYGIEDTHIKVALLNFTINLIGGIVLIAIYYNYILLTPYFSPFFWAVMISIPLHSIKNYLIEHVQQAVIQDGFSRKLILKLIKLPFKILLGPIWTVLIQFVFYYFRFVKFITPFKGDEQVPTNISSEQTHNKLPPTQNIADSTFYFHLLFRGYGLYFTYMIVNMVGLNYLLIGALILCVLALLHIIFSIIFAVIRYHFPWNFVISLKNYFVFSFQHFPFLVTGYKNIKLAFFFIFSIINKIQKSIKQAFRDFILENINFLITVFIILMFITLVVLLSSIFMIKAAQETNLLFGNSYMVINQFLRDHELDDQVKNFMEKFSDNFSLTSYLDYQAFPEYNMTIEVLREASRIFYENFDERDRTNYTCFPSSQSNITLELNDSSLPLPDESEKYSITCIENSENVSNSLRNDSKLLSLFPKTHVFIDKLTNGDPTYLSVIEMIQEWSNLLNYNGTSGSFQELYKRISEYTGTVMDAFVQSGGFLFKFLQYLVFGFLNLFKVFFRLMLDLLLFLTTLYYLLASKSSCIEVFKNLLVGRGTKLLESVEKSITGIFETSLKMYFFHVAFTWLTFSWFDIQYIFIGSFLSGIVALLPFFPSCIVSLPAVFELWLSKSQPTNALILFGLHFYVYWWINDSIYKDIPNSHHLIAGLSIILGVSSFGMYGILIGPILICFPVIVYEFITKQINSPNTVTGKRKKYKSGTQ